jgi:DNA-binding transcriptional MocR family regulator
MVDVMMLARSRHGDEAAARLRQAFAPEEVAVRLAAESGVVVQTGPSFQGDPWDVRLSLASITEAEAAQVARAFVELVDRLVAKLP